MYERSQILKFLNLSSNKARGQNKTILLNLLKRKSYENYNLINDIPF